MLRMKWTVNGGQSFARAEAREAVIRTARVIEDMATVIRSPERRLVEDTGGVASFGTSGEK
jgi:hypothetical protein